MITVAIDNNPLNGAAYQVLYMRTSPGHFVDRARQAAIKADFATVLAWAADQSPEVLAAYRWAADMIERQIDQQVSTNELGMNVQAALKTLPMPPAPKAPLEPDAEFRQRVIAQAEVLGVEVTADMQTLTGAHLDEIGARVHLARDGR